MIVAMSALEDVDHELGLVLGKLAEATNYLDEARDALEGTGTGLSVLVGTNDGEPQQALACHDEGGNQLGRAQEVLRRCTEQIMQYRTRVATTSTTNIAPLQRTAWPESRTKAHPPRGWGAVAGEKPNLADISAEKRRNYILDGNGRGGGGHFAGTGLPNKTEFPETWDDDQVISTIEEVAKNPDMPPELQDNGLWKVEGSRDGVNVRVVVHRSGRVVTGHPTGGHGVTHNDAHGNPR